MRGDEPPRAAPPPIRLREVEDRATSGPGPTEGVDPSDSYEEFLRLFARDRERIYSYIFSMLPHHADAEDVFQRCSLLLWRKFARFEPDGRFLSWACGIAFYEVCNFLRVAGRDRLRLDVDLVSQLAERRLETLDRDEDRLAALRRCLAKLRDSERELVQQVYYGGCSIKDLAESSGRAAQTLYNQLSQVRIKLFRCVQRSLDVQG